MGDPKGNRESRYALQRGAGGRHDHIGEDPYELVQRAASGFTELLQTVRLREDKYFPESATNPGWCPWNAVWWGDVPQIGYT